MTNKFEQHINQLLSFYGIRVKKWSKSSCGRAWDCNKTVIIPKPTDIDRFCVCLHEIGHIVNPCKSNKNFEKEYAAEMFAINQCRIAGYDCSDYKERARRYIIMNISKAHARKLNLKTIPDEIKQFCNINFSEWEGRKVFVRNWGVNTYKDKELVIEFLNS
jgi:hypothetical protein